MEYISITILAVLSFVAGWITKSLSVDKIVEQAKYDIQHVNELKQKEYKRGWSTGFEYRDGYEKNNIKAVMLSSDNENIILIYSDGGYKNLPVEHVERIIIDIERNGDE